MGMATPWRGPLEYRAVLALHDHFAAYIAIARDRSNRYNRVTLDGDGEPRIFYTLDRKTHALCASAQSELIRLMGASDASMILPLHEDADLYAASGDMGLPEYTTRAEKLGLKANVSQMFSAHQMGTCRYGTCTDTDGAIRDRKGLYVMDGSLLPTALGINPMITIESLAFMLARRLAGELAGDVSSVDRAYPAGPENAPLEW